MHILLVGRFESCILKEGSGWVFHDRFQRMKYLMALVVQVQQVEHMQLLYSNVKYKFATCSVKGLKVKACLKLLFS